MHGFALIGTDMKKCTKCLLIKNFEEFYKDKKSRDGRRSSCKNCQDASNKDYLAKKSYDIKSYQKEYYQKNSDKLKAYRRDYYERNKVDINNKHAKYMCQKRRNDCNFHLASCLRGGLYKALKGLGKSAKTMAYIGCDIEQLWRHLESKFKPEMTKENYGQWHVDHIIPLSSFDFTKDDKEEQLFLAWNYLNLQPLWKRDNLKKGSRL